MAKVKQFSLDGLSSTSSGVKWDGAEQVETPLDKTPAFKSTTITLSEGTSLFTEKNRPNLPSELSLLRRQIAVGLCAASIFFEGINLSLAGPFFPDQAIEKGLSLTEIGWVTAAFDITSLASSFFIASVISPQTLTFFYLSGLIWCAVSVATFGWSVHASTGSAYFHLCLASRSINGIGASMLQNTALPIAARLFPQKAGAITAIIHTGLGLGLVVGPTMGSLLLPLGGYDFPFLITGLLEGLTFVAATFIIPYRFRGAQLRPRIKTTEFVRFVIKPKVWCFLIPSLILFSVTGFRDSAFALYFQQTLGVSQDDVGYTFMACSGTFFLAAPFYGMLVEWGYGVHLLIVAQSTAGLGLFLFFLPKYIISLENIYYALIMLGIDGLLCSAVFNPHYLIIEKVAISEGYKNIQDIKTLAASCYNLIASSSRAVGAFVFGGYINEHVGFYNTCLVYAVVLLITGAWQTVYFVQQGLVKKLFYELEAIPPQPTELSMETNGVTEGDKTKLTISQQVISTLSRSYNVHDL